MIAFSGLSNIPSDLACEDGSSSVLINGVVENGEIRPIIKPAAMSMAGNLVYVHKVAENEIFILLEGDELFEYNEDENIFIMSVTGFIECSSIGNTLVVIQKDKAVEYCLRKGDGYKVLGKFAPELSLSMGLTGSLIEGEEQMFSVVAESVHFYDEFEEADEETATVRVLGEVNRFIAEDVLAENKFVFPFFARYAYRMYDGSLTMHSAPVLMIPSTSSGVFAKITRQSENGRDTYFKVMGNACKLGFHEEAGSIYDEMELSEWSDIILSVDIFVSAPIYTYDQSGRVKNFCSISENVADFNLFYNSFGVYKTGFDGVNDYTKNYIIRDEVDGSAVKAFVNIPLRDEKTVISDITTESIFYKFASIDLDKLRVSGVIEDHAALATIETQEVMTDDYISHFPIIAETSFAYNSRLNLSGIKLSVFPGYYPESMVCRWQNSSDFGVVEPQAQYAIFTEYSDTDGSIVVKAESTAGVSNQFGFFFYYPSTKATKMIVARTYEGVTSYSTIKLSSHSRLNGSYYFGGFNELSFSSLEEIPTVSTNTTISQVAKVYTSEVNNPFTFSVGGINTIGNSRVVALSSSSKAVSVGQFGEYPLYAFTEDGVWALEVNDVGLYRSKQTVARDVAISPDVLQLDGAVAFVTAKGLMLISGAETTCISDVLDGPTFKIYNLTYMDDVASATNVSNLYDIGAKEIGFNEYLKDSVKAYDYKSRRIIISNPKYTYSYVYSLNSYSWSMMEFAASGAVNNFPDSYMTYTGGEIYNISEYMSKDDDTLIDFMYISRPLKLGSIANLKLVSQLFVRGYGEFGSLATALYGSRAGVDYIMMASSKELFMPRVCGSPWKLFRLVISGKVKATSRLSGIDLMSEVKFNNKMR